MGFLERVLDGFQRTILPRTHPRRPEPSLQDVLPRLVPKVRPRFLFEALTLAGGGTCPEFRPLAGIFGLSLVADAANWELDVRPSDLERWGADFDALTQVARANLARRSSEDGFDQVRPGLFRSSWRDNLDGSRVLLPGVLKRLAVRGDPVVALPNRDTLLVAGADDPEALIGLLEASHQYMWDDPRAMNGCPLRLKGFFWEPWEAPKGHPAAALLAKVRRRRLVVEYTHQKDLLDRVHGRSGRAVEIASFHLEEASGAVASCTFLPRGEREGWLPVADRVGVLPEEKGIETLWLPWDDVLGRIGHLLEPVGVFPERYRLRHPEEIAGIDWAAEGLRKAS